MVAGLKSPSRMFAGIDATAPRPVLNDPGTPPDQKAPRDLELLWAELEAWAESNERDARKATRGLWYWKTPAILTAALAGALAAMNYSVFAALSAGACAVFILVDGIAPRGHLRGSYKRAVSDLRRLENQIAADWRSGVLEGRGSEDLAARIIKQATEERKKVRNRLSAAESAFDPKSAG